jgi:hypothetical protein
MTLKTSKNDSIKTEEEISAYDTVFVSQLVKINLLLLVRAYRSNR